MARTTNKPDIVAQTIHTRPVQEELEESFLVYSVSVITARSIPDVRDGLKPVHRRILFDMHRNKIHPDKPHVKSAKVVGSCIGSLHPHGDSAVYDALVRMAQPFSLNVPLIDGHGNFGTQDDPPAAYRYTECRLTQAAVDLIGELDEDTVDFVPNFDNTVSEPLYLPGSLPNLLINGSIGIAVGMNTAIYPYNPKEVLRATKLLLENPECADREFYALISGPDFPTGGLIVTPRSELRDIMSSGQGLITTRAKMEIVQSTKVRRDIVITQLPWTVGPEKVVSRINRLIKDGKLEAVSRVVDLSNQTQGLHILVECKPHADTDKVVDDLLRLTDLQTNLRVNQVALVDGSPKCLSTREILELFIKTRLDSIKRYAGFRLANAQHHLHLQEGLAKILADVAAVVAILEASNSVADARQALMRDFELDEEQANYILDMPLRRLVHIEKEQIYQRIRELQAEVKRYNTLVRTRPARRKEMASQLDTLLSRWGTPRKTAIGAPAA